MVKLNEKSIEPLLQNRYRGLLAYSQERKQKTVERLRAALQRLADEGRPVSASAVYQVSGLSFTTIRRNDEAYNLFCTHSDNYQKRAKAGSGSSRPQEDMLDSFKAYSRQRLIRRLDSEIQRVQELNTRLETEVKRREAVEADNLRLVEHKITDDMAIAKLRAQLARYESAFQSIRYGQGQAEQDNLPF
jgi:hypothetical protein